MVKMFVAEIRIDGGTQPRVAIDEAIVAEYVEALRAGVVLPAVVVFFDGTVYWLADGFHRLHAHRHAELDSIAVDIRDGTRRDAVLFSVGANAAHGLRRTNADKRQAVETVLADDEWRTWSDRRIAEVCGVSDIFVAKVRRELQTDCSSAEPGKRVGKDGKARKAPKRDEFDPGDKPAKAKPAAKVESEPDDNGCTDADTIDALREEVTTLKAEVALLKRAADPDAEARIRELAEYTRSVERRRDELMNENAQLIRQVKAQRRELDGVRRAA